MFYMMLRKDVKKNWDSYVVSMAHALVIISLVYSFKLEGSPILEKDHAFGWDPKMAR